MNAGTDLEGRSGKPGAAEPPLSATSDVSSDVVEALGTAAGSEPAESLPHGAPARAAEWQPLTTPEDAGDYPAESTLEAIKAWDPMRVNSLLAFVAKAWHWPEFGVSHTLRPEEAVIVDAQPGDVFLRLATGGWSGNEDIINALEQNRVASAFTWKFTSASGLHIYEYSQCQPDFPLPPGALTGQPTTKEKEKDD
jgi:hypothetical protein